MMHDILPEVEPATLDDPSVVEMKKKADLLYNSACNDLERVTNSIKMNEVFNIDKVVEIIIEVTELDADTLGVLHGSSMQLRDISGNIISHSVNVTIYSILLGTGLGYSREQLVQLGIAALLHDVSMLFIPGGIINKGKPLTERELSLIRKHPNYAYKILQNIGENYLWIAEVVCQLHERENGQGYPRGLKKHEIHDYAEVISIANVYEALTHPGPQRNYYTPRDAAKLLVAIHRNHFSDQLNNLITTRLPCFPVGSYVRLNSNEIGRVLKIHEYSQTRPTLELLLDSEGSEFPKRMIVNLAQIPSLKITDTFFEYDPFR